MKNYRVRSQRIYGVLRIGSAERYESRNRTGFKPEQELVEAKHRLPNAVHAGCYLDGELGVDNLGNPELTSWSVAEALFADDIPPISDLFLGFDALTKHMRAATLAPSVSAAMECCLQTVEAAGYNGGMISLVQDDGDQRTIVAHAALGERWRDVVMPNTRRPLGPYVSNDENLDILAIVANGGSKFVSDAQTDPRCRNETAREAGVISFYAVPLKAEDDCAIGVLQIDLGDLSDRTGLPDEQKPVLDALGDMVAAALNRAIRTEELELLRKLDVALIKCMDAQTPEEAISTYAKEAAREMSKHAAERNPTKELIEVGVHVRLHHREDDRLWLIDGDGPYYEALRMSNRRIAIPATESSSSTATALRSNKRVVNNAKNDTRTIALIEEYKGTPVADALKQIASYADFPIGEHGRAPIGIVSFSTPHEWFFSQARLRSLDDVGQRMSLLLTNISRKVNIEFLSSIAPPLSGERHLYRALANHMPNVARITKAQCISCFLWDEMRDRFVLRAQHGWDDGSWVGAAWYGENDGMTGTLAMNPSPTYIEDLREYKKLHFDAKLGKWLPRMFAKGIPDNETCEVIALPLRFRERRVGIVMLYRRRKCKIVESSTGFTTTNLNLLSEARDSLSAYVYAAQDYDYVKWREREAKRQDQVGEALRNLNELPEVQLLQIVCNIVSDIYRTRHCAIYLFDDSDCVLRLSAASRRLESAPEPISVIREPEKHDPRVLAFKYGKADEDRGGPASDLNDPEQVRTENLVQGAFIPLADGTETIGVLELRWKGQRFEEDLVILPHHSLVDLAEIARRISSAVQGSRARAQQRRSENALNAMSYYLGLGMHAFTNGVTAIQSTLNRLERHGDERTIRIVTEGRASLSRLSRVLHKAKALGDGLATSEQQACNLFDLLTDIIKRIGAVPQTNVLLKLVANDVAKTAQVLIDGEQLKECFRNLIDNAMGALCVRSDNEGEVVVRMTRCDTRNAWLVDIEDNGCGLSREEFERHSRRRKDDSAESRSLGLFLSRLFCEGNGCTLEYIDGVETGTKLRVVLPALGRSVSHD